MDGDDTGRWLERQKQPGTWAQLPAEQQERLSQPGVQPLEAPPPAPAATRTAKGPSKAEQPFRRGLAALAQWVEREGADRPVPRGRSEQTVADGEAEPVAVKPGAWNSNTRARRDKLTSEQQAALREMGMQWAKAAVPAPPSPASGRGRRRSRCRPPPRPCPICGPAVPRSRSGTASGRHSPSTRAG